MQVLDATAAAAATSNSQTSTTTTTSGSPTDQLTNESTFLQLLVSQIQNQDPLNPTDSQQFIGQLVQFNQLEQLLGINQGVQQLVNDTPASTTPPTGGGTNTNPITQ
jgi:flagellar basal-body rod modification protein FlgD